MDAAAANLTWHAGSVLPYASLWHTVRRVAALNALQWCELPFATLPSTGTASAPCRSLDLLFNESCRDGYRSGAAGLSMRRLASALAEPYGNFAWSHLRRLPVGNRSLVYPFMRICPACLAMGYHSALLCLKPLSRCPIHHIELINACVCGHRFEGAVDRSALQVAGCCPCGRTGFFTRETCRRPTMKPQDTRPLRPVAAWLEAISKVTLPDRRPKQSRHSCETKVVTPAPVTTADRPEAQHWRGFPRIAKQRCHFAIDACAAKQSCHCFPTGQAGAKGTEIQPPNLARVMARRSPGGAGCGSILALQPA